MKWFRKREAVVFIHPTLGQFSHDGPEWDMPRPLTRWRGNITAQDTKLWVQVTGTATEPDALLLETGGHVADNIEYYLNLAYIFMEQNCLGIFAGFIPQQDARLSGFTVNSADGPAFTLEFGVAKAQNMLDIRFVGDTITDGDYH